MLPSPQFSSLPVRAGVSAFSLWKIFVPPGIAGGILLPSLWLLCTFPARVAAGWEQRWCSGRSCPHPRLSRASPPELGNGASPSISSARSLRMAARISLRSSYSPAARSCKREGPKKEAGSAPAQVPSQQTVCPGTQSLTSFVSSSTLVMALSCSDKAVRAACCSSSRCRDLSRVESSGRLGAVMGACEQSPLVGHWQIQAAGPTRSKAALCLAAPTLMFTQICPSHSGARYCSPHLPGQRQGMTSAPNRTHCGQFSLLSCRWLLRSGRKRLDANVSSSRSNSCRCSSRIAERMRRRSARSSVASSWVHRAKLSTGSGH